MIKKQLLYFIYGGRDEYRHEAKFSMLTALDQLGESRDVGIRIITDQPEAFSGWPVEVEPVSAQTLSLWEGKYGYVHRKKACAIAAGLRQAEKTIFVDSDTYFLSDPARLFDYVGVGEHLMHAFEWNWAKTAEFREFVGLRAKLSEQGRQPPETLRLYNSGICGVTNHDGPLLAQCLEMIDAWHAYCSEIHIIEQVALSVVMHGSQVREAKNEVRHYYSEKRYFHAMLSLFFRRHGEAFRPELIHLSREVPRNKPVPRPWWRLWMKCRLLGMSKAVRKPARGLLYGCLLPRDDYSQACRQAWWEGARKELQDNGLDRVVAYGNWPREIPHPPADRDMAAALNFLRERV